MEVLTRPWLVGEPASKVESLLQVQTKDEEDDYDSVADDFLSLLKRGSSVVPSCSESGEDSLFLQQFEEEESLVESGLELDDVHSPEYAKFRMEKVDVHSPQQDTPDSRLDSDNSDILDWNNRDDVELAALLETAEAELQKAMQTLQTRARAKLLEDEETKSLMQEWGLKDSAFAASQPLPWPSSNHAMVPLLPAPPLGNGLGPVLHMRDGSSLRSMSRTHFQGSGRLVMQVSSPVVVPSEMGATSMDILRSMAMSGMEGMAAQAMVAMPLEDIAGKGVDQISIEHRDASFPPSLGSRSKGVPALGFGESNALALRENGFLSKDLSRTSTRNGRATNANDDYMNLEDLAPMAMLKIEALALEGLKIQAEMADQDAPSIVEVPVAEESKSPDHRMKEFGGIVPLLDDGKHCTQDSNFMSMAVSLDEWMRLDAGVCREDETEEQTLAIIAAHNTAHNTTQNSRHIQVYRKQKDKHGKDLKHTTTGFMGDTITLAMLVQLRDPLRNHEPVGAPMMALVQAEREMAPPKPKLARRMPTRRNDDDDDDDDVANPKPRFKIVGVTVAGLKTSTTTPIPTTSKAEIWGNKKQLQAGSRWLVANGMHKATKMHTALKRPKAAPAPQVKVQRGESLWSISVRVHGSGAKWRDLAKLNPHIRNPDIIFPDTTLRTH